MYAVATVHFKRSVKVDQLISRLAAPTALAVAITKTIFDTKPAIVVEAVTATTVYSHLGPSAVCRLLKQGDMHMMPTASSLAVTSRSRKLWASGSGTRSSAMCS